MEYTSEQYRLLTDPAYFFRDFTKEEIIDWLYIDEYSLVSEEPNFVEDVMANLIGAEMFELADAVSKHMEKVKLRKLN